MMLVCQLVQKDRRHVFFERLAETPWSIASRENAGVRAQVRELSLAGQNIQLRLMSDFMNLVGAEAYR